MGSLQWVRVGLPAPRAGPEGPCAVWKPKYDMNWPRIFLLRQIEVQRKVQLEGGG